MRPHATALIAALVFALPLAAAADETWTCWTEVADRGDDGARHTTRCRLAGQSVTVDYGSVADVPVVLSPQVGADGDGLCWFWTTRSSHWVVLGVDDDGNATMGIDPDGAAGGPLIVDAEYPRCTTEPAETPTVLMEAYELLSRYDHPSPAPAVDPPPGAGVAGMEVFIADTPPPRWTASLVSPHSGRRIEVETFVEAIAVTWGDGTETLIPETAFGMLTGWPEGAFAHIYETKTCAVPGGDHCHPSLTAYDLTVGYQWAARYRVDTGAWLPIPVPVTSTSVSYDVDEILSQTTAVG